MRSVRADLKERTRTLPGDDLIAAPLATLTHAITIHGAPRDVWPWLAQMGAGSRAGWYSYDLLDNGRRPSASRIVPELQHIDVGTIFPALPGIADGFRVLAFEPERFLVLGWPDAGGRPVTTWSFVLEARGRNWTRLIVRARGTSQYSFHALPAPISKHIIRFVHFIMERKQLAGIANRVETFAA